MIPATEDLVEGVAQNIAYRLRTVVVAAAGAERIEGGQQVIIKGQGYALHGMASLSRVAGKGGAPPAGAPVRQGNAGVAVD